MPAPSGRGSQRWQFLKSFSVVRVSDSAVGICRPADADQLIVDTVSLLIKITSPFSGFSRLSASSVRPNLSRSCAASSLHSFRVKLSMYQQLCGKFRAIRFRTARSVPREREIVPSNSLPWRQFGQFRVFSLTMGILAARQCKAECRQDSVPLDKAVTLVRLAVLSTLLRALRSCFLQVLSGCSDVTPNCTKIR